MVPDFNDRTKSKVFLRSSKSLWLPTANHLNSHMYHLHLFNFKFLILFNDSFAFQFVAHCATHLRLEPNKNKFSLSIIYDFEDDKKRRQSTIMFVQSGSLDARCVFCACHFTGARRAHSDAIQILAACHLRDAGSWIKDHFHWPCQKMQRHRDT